MQVSCTARMGQKKLKLRANDHENIVAGGEVKALAVTTEAIKFLVCTDLWSRVRTSQY